MLIGIEFLNTKQFSATLSPPSIKLSKFIGGKVPPPKKKKKKKSICGPDFETFPNIQNPLTLKSKWAEIAPTPVYIKVQKLAS